MYIEVEENPNCQEMPGQVFEELSSHRVVKQMWLMIDGKRVLCWIASVEKGGAISKALAQKVSDSGAGISILVYGGGWGIRFKPVEYEKESWDFSNPHQWGEPYLFYGDEKDLVYET